MRRRPHDIRVMRSRALLWLLCASLPAWDAAGHAPMSLALWRLSGRRPRTLLLAESVARRSAPSVGLHGATSTLRDICMPRQPLDFFIKDTPVWCARESAETTDASYQP